MKEIKALTEEEILGYVRARRYSELRTLLTDELPEDTAQLLSDIPPRVRTIAFRLLPKEYAAECFVALSADARLELIEGFTDKELTLVLDEMFLDDTVDLIEEMPANVVKKILRLTSEVDRVQINRLLGYPKDSAGSLMTPEYVRLLPTMTVEDALSHIRRVAIDSETVYTCYVTDGKRRLLGTVSARQLLISPTDRLLSDIMTVACVSVGTHEERETAVNLIRKYGLLALPVVDGEGRLVGIVTVDDAVDAMSEETEEDFAKMAAIIPSEGEYLKTSVFKLFRARIPWLLLLLISATLSSILLARFEMALPAVLVLFVPMLMDTGGNCGSQSSVTVIRSMSLGNVSPRSAPRVLLKELSVGVLCATVLAVMAFLKVLIVDRYLQGNAEVTLSVALAVAAALAVTVIIAKLIGASLPLLVRLIGLDPAVMASPFITTIVDALSLVVYFFIADAVLP